ncbi:MAG TPA: response regulator transcription factor [Anaerolineaceae bacterium]|nr:response regulator transcription factor [Anaerolineaceae bacterium]
MSKSEKRAKTALQPVQENPELDPKNQDIDLSRPSRRSEGEPVNVALVDSSQTFREGLVAAIQNHSDLRLAGQLDLAEQVFTREDFSGVHVCLIDVDLRDRSGIEVAHWLKEKHPGLAVLLLSHWDWDVYLVAARVACAAGMLVRSTPSEELINQICGAAAGPIYSPDQLHRIRLWKKDVGDRLKKVNAREWEILWLAAGGYKNRQIAEYLSLSENTVEKYVTRLLEKVRLTSRSSLLAFIYLNHLDALIRLPDQRRYLYVNPAADGEECG